MATGVITYTVAVAEQERSSYSDYILETEHKNAELAKTGKEPLPILARDSWLKEIHKPRLYYADFVDEYLKTNKSASPVLSFDDWKATEYSKMLAKREEDYKKAINNPNLHKF